MVQARTRPVKDPVKDQDYTARPAREGEHLCGHCGAPLRTPREQSARLCNWCEEGLNKLG